MSKKVTLKAFGQYDEFEVIDLFHCSYSEKSVKHILTEDAIYVGISEIGYGSTGTIEDVGNPNLRKFIPHGEEYGYIINVKDLYFGDYEGRDRFGRRI